MCLDGFVIAGLDMLFDTFSIKLADAAEELLGLKLMLMSDRFCITLVVICKQGSDPALRFPEIAIQQFHQSILQCHIITSN